MKKTGTAHPSTSSRTRIVSFRAPNGLADAIDAAAARGGVTRNELLNRAAELSVRILDGGAFALPLAEDGRPFRVGDPVACKYGDGEVYGFAPGDGEGRTVLARVPEAGGGTFIRRLSPNEVRRRAASAGTPDA